MPSDNNGQRLWGAILIQFTGTRLHSGNTTGACRLPSPSYRSGGHWYGSSQPYGAFGYDEVVLDANGVVISTTAMREELLQAVVPPLEYLEHGTTPSRP